jgi:hypothetical protein
MSTRYGAKTLDAVFRPWGCRHFERAGQALVQFSDGEYGAIQALDAVTRR